ncbi:Neuronal PAS domain-containing protein 4 [Papilio xuthus]|uniref:Neuronal PAS domain-containing protein 4 n=1 Tax=Papilio xuthus TaxID=66420 RepID=A0A194Q183_PAPXU|nr:Neuronal PAS domain-containing protein 4 [Papilio xuthus]
MCEVNLPALEQRGPDSVDFTRDYGLVTPIWADDDDVFSRFDQGKSTKGASKLRRDLINAEIANLRDLLPLPPSTRQRLSQLQLMALVCVYVRKSNYFQQGEGLELAGTHRRFVFSQQFLHTTMGTSQYEPFLWLINP